MNLITLPGTDLRVSRFIFGTASLFNVKSSKARHRLLDAAVGAGFTHFDTAPYYGFGVAESSLKPILKLHPNITFSTKVGLYPPGGTRQSPTSVFLRKAAGRVLKSFSRAEVDFSLVRARQSLESSAKATGRDTIDLYLVHEAQQHLLVADEWQKWLDDCVTKGAIRRYGLALTADRLAPFLTSNLSDKWVIQVGDSLDLKEADVLTRNGRSLQITYGYLSAARQRCPGSDGRSILSAALRRNPNGPIIVSTTQIERLGQYSNLANEGFT